MPIPSSDSLGLIPMVTVGEVPGAEQVPSADDLEICLVTDEVWLEAGYKILAAQFEEQELDPIDWYLQWLREDRCGSNTTPLVMLAGYFRRSTQANLAGVVSGNLMPILESARDNQDNERRNMLFAIGHQVTTTALRTAGVRGVGTRLWSAALEAASVAAHAAGRTLDYSVLEAQSGSVGFWSRLGYRSPRNMRYWQPPLVFSDDGTPLHPPVPETLMLRGVTKELSELVSTRFILDVVYTLYECWSVSRYRNLLSRQAVEKIEHQVFGTLLRNVAATLPVNGYVSLIDFTPGLGGSDPAEGAPDAGQQDN